MIFLRMRKKVSELFPKKHQQQIAKKSKSLASGDLSGDPLRGRLADYSKLASGEYRIIYYSEASVIKVALLEKRNDAAVYKKAKRRS